MMTVMIRAHKWEWGNFYYVHSIAFCSSPAPHGYDVYSLLPSGYFEEEKG